MKKALILGGFALFLIGCGTQGNPKPGLQSDGSTYAGLYLQGVARGEYTSVLVNVGDLKITADGQELALSFSKETPDLAATGATSLANFRVPKGAQNIEVALRLDDWGGFEYGGDVSAKGAGYIDVRNPVMRFQAPVSWLQERGHAVVAFDRSRSLVPVSAGRLALVPQMQVLY
jgi:hypothetical protein